MMMISKKNMRKNRCFSRRTIIFLLNLFNAFSLYIYFFSICSIAFLSLFVVSCLLMIGKKKIVCVIPARLHSVRFPKKLLALLSGKPLIQWAWEGAMSIPFFDEVVIAVDSEELAFAVEGFGGKYHRTSVECQNGTARLVELQQDRKS